MVEILNRGPTLAQFYERAREMDPDDIFCVYGNSVTISGKNARNNSEQNKATREAFDKALRREFSADRFKRICSHYDLDWDYLKTSSKPLDRRLVEIFGVGAASLHERDLAGNLHFWNSSLRYQTVEKIRELVNLALPFTYYGDIKDPKTVHGAPEKGYQHLVSDKFGMDQQRISHFPGIRKLVSSNPLIPKMHPYYQRLVVSMVGHFQTVKGDKDEGLVIPAPGEELNLDFYKVHKIISVGGLTAIAFVPISDYSSLAPVLAFRGTKMAPTQEGAVESWCNDTEENIGESGYKAARRELAELMDDPSFSRGKKIDVIAFSLGGAHATYFMEDNRNWKLVRDFIGFNITGTSEKIVESVSRQINEMSGNWVPPNFHLHRNVSQEDGEEGDWVNFAGQKHIGWGIKNPRVSLKVYEWLIDDLEAPTKQDANILFQKGSIWGEFHSKRSMELWATPYSVKIYEGPTQCNPILNTYSRDPTVENARRSFGDIIHPTTWWIYTFLDFVFRFIGFSFFQKNPGKIALRDVALDLSEV